MIHSFSWRRLCAVACVSLLAAGAAACGSSSSSSSSAGGGQAGGSGMVTIKNFSFMPDNVTVKVGETVTFSNQDSSTHTATGDNKEFDTGNLSNGKSGTFTPKSAGKVTYHCNIHNYMHGTITVTG